MHRARVHWLVPLTLFGAAAAWGHHGTAGFYDQTRLITAQGVVTQFDWRNPHCGLFLSGKDESGREVTYQLEMGSPGTLAKVGFTRNTFRMGDAVVARYYPSFTNPTAGELESNKVTVNGKAVYTGSAGKAE